jgi:toxin-antitoxin system PIN domain toxin
MVVVDANVLIYAVNERAPQHAAAKRWIEEALNGTESVGFAWLVLLAFIRLATLPAVFPQPLDISTALDLVDAWLLARASVVLEPTSRHAAVLSELLRESGTAGNLVSDAHLAALAIEHDGRVCTFDRDFARFPGVRSFMPM